MARAHEDFGEKIGGAKKDLWKDRGLYVDDLDAMNDREAEKFVKKDNIWKMKSGKCCTFSIRRIWTAMSITTRSGMWSRAGRWPLTAGWRKWTAALTGRKYSFISRCYA